MRYHLAAAVAATGVCLSIVNSAAHGAATSRGTPNAHAATAPTVHSSTWIPHTLYVGSSGLVELTLSVSDATLQISSFTVAGANAAQYSITRDRCTGSELYVGHTCLIDFQVNASVPYGMDAQVVLATDQGPVVVDVPVDTPAQPLKYAVSALHFVHIPFLTTATDTLLITNPNPIEIDLDMTANGGIQSDPFNEYDVDVGTCSHIPANGNCTLTFHYTPTAGYWSGSWGGPLARNDATGLIEYTDIMLYGDGSPNKTVEVELNNYFNVDAFVEVYGAAALNGGLDGLGNAYSAATFQELQPWLNQDFRFGVYQMPNGVANATIAVTPGNYYGVTILGTAVFGPLHGRAFVLQYSDGSHSTVVQDMSDWKTPQHFPNEDIAVAAYDRIGPNGQDSQPVHQYNAYGYFLPADHTKTLMSVMLPTTRDVIVLGMNLQTYPMNKAVDLSSVFNTIAVRHDGTTDSSGGIDRQGNALSYEALSSAATLNDTISPAITPNQPNAVTSAAVELPAGQYASIRLLGMGVNGEQKNQAVVVSYTDGTQTTLLQSFNDWHNMQSVYAPSVERERRNAQMTYRLNADGSAHQALTVNATGTYMVYEYSLPLDPTKTAQSIQLPKNKNVVILAMYVQP